MSLSETSKQKAWLEHYQRLLNIEFDWDPDHLSDELPVEGPPSPIIIDLVKKAISQMKAGKAPGPSGIVVMIQAAADMGASMIRDCSCWHGCLHDSWPQLQSFVMARYPLTGSRVSLSASTRERGGHWKKETNWFQVDRADHESPGEDNSQPHQTVGVNWRFPVWLRPRKTHNRRNLCCQAADISTRVVQKVLSLIGFLCFIPGIF